MKFYTYSDLKFPGYPDIFRYVVMSKELPVIDLQESWKSPTTLKMYVAVVIEWDVKIQSDDLNKVEELLECLIIQNAYMAYSNLEYKIKPASEDYQRIATRGDLYIPVSNQHKEFIGDSISVIKRGTIDMMKSQAKIKVPK